MGVVGVGGWVVFGRGGVGCLGVWMVETGRVGGGGC